MKVLITGAKGMLGSALCPELLKCGYKILATDITFTSKDITYLDIRDKKNVEDVFKDFKPDIVFHLAASTDVDRCENEREEAFNVNTLGTENIVSFCTGTNINMVYISTAAVFDGRKKEPYTELDQPNPLNIYAKTKLEGEKIVQRILRKYFIVRAGWMIGGIDKDKKFVLKIIRQLQSKKEILAVTDKKGSPTFTKDLSKGLIELFPTQHYGLYHMANKGSCSRYDLAKLIVKLMGRDDVVVRPVSSDVFPLRAPRPDSEAIRNSKLEALGMNNIRTWEEALEEYITTIKQRGDLLNSL